MNKNSDKGIILIMAILALLVAAIFLPALLMVSENETKWSIKQKKMTTAFHMAEQGLDRGIWKLQESDSVWDAVSSGSVITGYDFNTVYASTDSNTYKEGEYKVLITSGTAAERCIVRSKGRDKSTDEIRGLEVELTKSPLDAGLTIRGGLTYKSGTRVHWGPIINYGNIDTLPNSPDNPSAYPRKISKGYINQRTPTGAGGPHGDVAELWNGTYDHYCHVDYLGEAPTINLDKFRQIAKDSSIKPIASDSGGTATADPVGSGYFPTDGIELKIPGGGNTQEADAYLFNSSTSVIFVEKTYSFGTRNKYSQVVLRGFIMPNATLSINGDSAVPPRTVRIPDDARKEYLYNGTHGNSTLGWSQKQGNNATSFSSTGAGSNFIVEDVMIHGYAYFKNISNSGTDLVVAGALDMAEATNPQSVVVYYDKFVSTGIPTINQKPRTLYWREIKTSW